MDAGAVAVETLISSSTGVLAVLVGIAAFYFFLEERTQWKFFQFFPPLLWIYATPVVLNNLDVIPTASPVYDTLRSLALPVFIVLMLLNVDVAAAVRVMGRGVLVMLLGSIGVVVGGVVSYAIVGHWLDEGAWRAFGTLAGSWIGGTGNMAAAAEGLGATPEHLGLAILADNLVYVVWLPILLGCKSFADRFNKWARVDESRLHEMEKAALAEGSEEVPVEMRHYLYLGAIAVITAWTAGALAPLLPELQPVLSTSTWNLLLVTTFALGLSVTSVSKIPGSQNLAIALIYLFVAGMGARAALSGLGQAPAFVLGAFIWIFIHGAFILAGAYFLRVDMHSVAIASAANVGGAASAPVVAAYHRESLVPASILMALIGYALGNYLAILTGQLCRMVGGG
jgi:uncharacterized membrane protein